MDELNLSNTIWTHSGYWDKNWSKKFNCKHRYFINNIGKDIGGKLFGFKVLLDNEINDEYALFLHDKRSPQVIDGEKWKNELWSIAKKKKIEEALLILENNPEVGIVAGKKSVLNPEKVGDEYAYAKNKEIIFTEAKKYNIISEDQSFVAGTMFIARLSPLIDFFKQNDPLIIRAGLENGNVLDLQNGTFTHAWERLLSWIITSKGYRIEGI